jgi:UDP-glucose 4-epimerase
MKNILITGCAGFIGSNLMKRLIDEGHNVEGVDDLSNGERAFLPTGDYAFFERDFADEVILRNIKNQEYDIVYHLAAAPRVGYSVDYPAETTENNIMKPVKLLEACRGNVERFVNTSSSSVYGDAFCHPTPESSPHLPQSPYALQKSVMENFCIMFSKLYKMDTVSIRPFNVFGPNCRGTSPYSTAVSAWLHAIKHGTVLRSDGDGLQTRDMTHVDNVVDVFVRVGMSKLSFTGQAFNAGTGVSVSNNEILDWFKREYSNCLVKNAPERLGDVKHTLADMSNSIKQLGHQNITPFWSGLELTKHWAMNSPIF